MDDPTLIITGTGRCGTHFMAHALHNAGHPCTHEGLFTPWERNIEWQPPCAESSWLAAPYLDEFPKTPKVLLYRSPFQVVRSLLGIYFFGQDGPYRDFALKHEPDLAVMRWATACWMFYLRWNQRIIPHADMVIDIDDLSSTKIQQLCDLTGRVGGRVDPFRLESIFSSWNPSNTRERANRESVERNVPQPLIDEAWSLYKDLQRL